MILAVLADLIYERIEDRRRFDTLVAKDEMRKLKSFYPDRLSSPSLNATLSTAQHEIFVVGFSFSHLIHTQQSTITNLARRGCRVKLAVWCPSDKEPERTLLVNEVGKLVDIPDLKGFLENALSRIHHWYSSLDQQTRQNIEIKGYTALPTTTVLFVDSDYPQGYVRVEPIIYKMTPQDVPSFECSMNDAQGLYQTLKDRYSQFWTEAQSLM